MNAVRAILLFVGIASFKVNASELCDYHGLSKKDFDEAVIADIENMKDIVDFHINKMRSELDAQSGLIQTISDFQISVNRSPCKDHWLKRDAIFYYQTALRPEDTFGFYLTTVKQRYLRLLDYSKLQKNPAKPQKQLSSTEKAFICRATIATAMGHPINIVKLKQQGNKKIDVWYSRPADGKRFNGRCSISQSGKVSWRMFDDYSNKWGKTHSNITYSLSGNMVTITETYSDQTQSSESYALPK